MSTSMQLPASFAGTTKDSKHQLKLKAQYTILPGSFGGVLANLALAGRSIYVATIDLPLTYTSLNQPRPNHGPGPRPTRRSRSPATRSSFRQAARRRAPEAAIRKWSGTPRAPT
jgi:hypothetical protein